MSASQTGTAVEETRDRLTGLPDRASFMTRLKRDSLRTMTSGGLMALIVLNIDQFRRINSVFGMHTGDLVLKEVGNRLNAIARRHDLVARIGSDEFALILPGVMNEGHAVLAANKIQREFQVPLELDNQRVPLTVTVGVAICPTHSSHAETLFKQAEVALTRARSIGANYLVAEPVKAMEITETWDMEIELESAVENEELELHYQPIVSLRDGSIVAAEGLMRWNSPSRGLLLPGDFIPVAEETGRIQSLTQWALNSALRQAGEVRKSTGREVPFAVNMPASAYQNPNLIDLVSNAMRLWDATHGQLILEVTESLAMADPETAFETMKRLRELGVGIAIDDFGTGYSSLSYFRDIPADKLKIDKVFIKRMEESEADATLVDLMIQLGHRFDMKIVAEGLETEQALSQLQETRCDEMQGRLITGPLPFEEFTAWVKERGGNWRA